MVGEWSKVDLADLAASRDGAIAIGPFGSAMKADVYVPHGVPIIRGTNISDGRDLVGDWVFVPESFADAMPRCVIGPGDLVFPHRGSIGEVALVPSDRKRYFLSTSFMKITIDPCKADRRFVYYYFKSNDGRSEIMKFASQVGTPGIGQPLASLRKFKVPCPPLPIQVAIADLLWSLDDKIQLNRRMVATLDAVARTLFKSWFVDFDPVHAKAEGRPSGLPNDLAVLFPDRWVEGPGGRVPEGWTVHPLSVFAEASRGLSYKGSGLTSQGLVLHNLNSIYEGGGYKREGVKYYSGAYAERHKIEAGDIIVANTEQGHDRRLIGFAAIVPAQCGKTEIFSQHLYRLRLTPSSPVSVHWLCHLLNAQASHGIVSGYGNGSTVNMLPIEAVQEPRFSTPPSGLVEAFDAIAQPAHARIEKILDESRTLADLRDTLLPKLISGELRIADAEQQIAAA